MMHLVSYMAIKRCHTWAAGYAGSSGLATILWVEAQERQPAELQDCMYMQPAWEGMWVALGR